MKKLILICALAGAVSAQAATFSGNGSSAWGGPIGQSTLSLSDDGTTLSGTLTKGPGGLNDVLVLYVDSVAGGLSDTSTLTDSSDGLRKAISGYNGTDRSLVTFASGFTPDYAIALGPKSDNFGGLWQLVPGTLTYVNSANLAPTGTDSSPTYTFSLPVADLGVSPGGTLRLFGTYISNSGYRSPEALAGDLTGAEGWNPFTQTAFSSYTVVPEPGSLALLALGGLAMVALRRK